MSYTEAQQVENMWKHIFLTNKYGILIQKYVYAFFFYIMMTHI